MGYYIEEAIQQSKINLMDAPTFFMESAQLDIQLFEGLIELDFAEVYNEAGIISLTEADEEEAEDVSVEASNRYTTTLWDKFKQTISKLLKDIRDKIAEFISKIQVKSLEKILNDPNAKNCTNNDIWFSDYMEACDQIISKSKIDDYINDFDIYGQAGTDNTNNNFNVLYQGLTDELDEINKIPTDLGENYKTIKKDGKEIIDTRERNKNFNDMVSAVELSKKSNEFKNLAEFLSVKGLNKRIDKCFDMIKKDDSNKFKVRKGDSERVIRVKRGGAAFVTKLRVTYFKAEIKICMNTAKIAMRNFQNIKYWVKNPKSNNENAMFDSIVSDFICESIFEF